MKGKRISALVFVLLFLVYLTVGCAGGGSTGGDGSQTPYIVAGAFYNQADGPFVVAEVTKGSSTVENAKVLVNGTELSYGLPLSDQGIDLGYIPFYYKALNFSPGNTLTLQASLPGEDPFYEGTVTVPSAIALSQPAQGAIVNSGSSINVSWNSASNTLFYYLTYAGSNNPEDSFFDAVLGSGTTTSIIPSSYTFPDTSTVQVSALNGENLDELFAEDTSSSAESDEEDPPLDKSYWVASTYDYKDLLVQLARNDEDDTIALYQNSVTRAVEPLRVKSIKRIKEGGIWLTLKMYDPEQIVAPGVVYISVKLKKRHIAACGVQVYDMNGSLYYNWKKVRIYKRKSKKYHHTINVSPGSTVGLAKKQTDELRTDYEY